MDSFYYYDFHLQIRYDFFNISIIKITEVPSWLCKNGEDAIGVGIICFQLDIIFLLI